MKPNQPFDLGFTQTLDHLIEDTDGPAPPCPFTPASDDAVDWWSGAQAAHDEYAMMLKRVNKQSSLTLVRNVKIVTWLIIFALVGACFTHTESLLVKAICLAVTYNGVKRLFSIIKGNSNDNRKND